MEEEQPNSNDLKPIYVKPEIHQKLMVRKALLQKQSVNDVIEEMLEAKKENE